MKSKNFLRDNFYLLVGAAVINISGFLFHFFMGRKLGPVDYGTLATVISLVALFGVFTTSIQFSISKFVASMKAEGSLKKIRYLYSASLKKFTGLFVVIAIGFLLLSFYLDGFLKVNYSYLFIASLMILTIPFISVFRGFLQGLQNFKSFGISLGIEGVSKLALGIIFVLLYQKVGLAITAILLSNVAVAVYCFYKVKEYSKGEKEWFSSKSIYGYAFPMFLTVLLFTLFYSIDLILVKHFFSSIDAGYFAAISLIGKIIFFASFSVVQVMFPKVVELAENGSPHEGVFMKSFWIITLIALVILPVYYFFGDLIISTLFGSSYTTIASLIFPYGLFMASVSFSKLYSLYFLSLKKFKFLYFFGGIIVLEIGGIYAFHDSLAQVIGYLLLLGMVLWLFLAIISLRLKKNG
ncbi:MAG: oligosaccharide flippase family protein [Nanoarchaeota archaeon]|nr:oligosaccharide flippase family protein [Nanoarchaeota archaeon]